MQAMDNTFTLEERGGFVWLDFNGKSLKLTCQPCEPCMYISQADGKVTTLHNSFNPSVVLEMFAEGSTVSSITGRVYRPADFCGLIWNTVMEWGPQGVQIDDAERNYIKVLMAAPLHFLPIDPGPTRLEKEKNLMGGVVIGELSLDLVRYIYVIRLQEHAQACLPVFGQLSDDDYHMLRHYNDITDWDPLEGDISPKKPPLTLEYCKFFASKNSLCGSHAGERNVFGPEDLVKELVYSRK